MIILQIKEIKLFQNVAVYVDGIEFLAVSKAVIFLCKLDLSSLSSLSSPECII